MVGDQGQGQDDAGVMTSEIEMLSTLTVCMGVVKERRQWRAVLHLSMITTIKNE